MPFINTAIKQLMQTKVLSFDDLDIMTEITNITEDMVKDYPVDGSVYLTGIFLQGAKWEDSYSDELDPKISAMYVFAIK